jgi:hypothetical protein
MKLKIKLSILIASFFLTGLLILSGTSISKACEIEFRILENPKAQYSPGEELIVKVKVKFTHRVCPEGIENTKFNSDGIKITGATKWVETSPGTFERKLKILVTSDASGTAVLKAVRSCEKDGGLGVLQVQVN